MSTTEETGPRARLIEAAGEVFAEHGFRAATIREITRRAGVNVAAVNYYFRDKEELYSATLLHAHKAACTLRPEDAGALPPEDRLHHFVHALLSRFLDPRRPRWHGQLMAREMAEPTPMLRHLIDEVFRPNCRWISGVLSELGGGRFDAEQLDYITTSVLGQCVFYRQNRPIIQSFFPDLLGRDALVDRLARHITDFSLAAIRNLPGKSLHHEHLAESR
ncbi:MAG: CerR family C-terminal domain-containing protein [Terrimicrobiaceae bacterium]|nr:CerR family C-terminal domain-containing protein [Terrimicrobiaceae bacterium]